MKKLITLIMAMMICLTLVACGGVDKQPVIDAFNTTSTAFDELANEVNANPDAYPQEFIDVMNQMADSLLQCKELLESDQELTQEQVDELIKNLNDIDAWVADARETFVEAAPVEAEEGEVTLDKESVTDAFNYVSTIFDETATAVNADPDAYPQEFIDGMVSISESLSAYKEILESDQELTEAELLEIMENLVAVEEALVGDSE